MFQIDHRCSGAESLFAEARLFSFPHSPILIIREIFFPTPAIDDEPLHGYSLPGVHDDHESRNLKVETMNNPPSLQEWLLIYAPIGGFLTYAYVLEREYSTIKNSLVLLAFIFLLTMRIVIDPSEYTTPLMSTFVAGCIVIPFGFVRGCVGAGTAKYAMALSAGLTMSMSILLSLGLVLVAHIFVWTHRWHKSKQLLGSLVLMVLIALPIVVKAVVGIGRR